MAAISLACSCHHDKYTSKEHFTGDHIFSYLISGINTIDDGHKKYVRKSNSFVLLRKNKLVKVCKQPIAGSPYRSISVKLGQEFLENFSREYNYIAEQRFSDETLTELQSNEMLRNVMESLIPYFEADENEIQDVLILKAKELVLLLLKYNPDLKNLLFDFSQPGKIDLEEFMNLNFTFNISLERFAYLTGRSLTSYKRDFRRIFNIAPGKWLLEKRLNEAYHLINKNGQKPSSVYLKVGFEDLSHFSFAFKKRFGINPSVLLKTEA